jgi:hypothetical protein
MKMRSRSKDAADFCWETWSIDTPLFNTHICSHCTVFGQNLIPHKHAKCKHKELLQAIVTRLLGRAKADNYNTFMKVNSHIGIQGNEAAYRLAGVATDTDLCDQHVNSG